MFLYVYKDIHMEYFYFRLNNLTIEGIKLKNNFVVQFGSFL